jgi:hypothetical protein
VAPEPERLRKGDGQLTSTVILGLTRLQLIGRVGIWFTTPGGREMRMRLFLAATLCAAAVAGAGATAALAAPNSNQAGCEAILTLTDTPGQFRDDLAREFAALDFPPGDIYSLAARATGTTEEECLASIGF